MQLVGSSFIPLIIYRQGGGQVGVGECTCKDGKGFGQRCCVGTGADTKLLDGVCTGAGIVWESERGGILVTVSCGACPPEGPRLPSPLWGWANFPVLSCTMGAPLVLK